MAAPNDANELRFLGAFRLCLVGYGGQCDHGMGYTRMETWIVVGVRLITPKYEYISLF